MFLPLLIHYNNPLERDPTPLLFILKGSRVLYFIGLLLPLEDTCAQFSSPQGNESNFVKELGWLNNE